MKKLKFLILILVLFFSLALFACDEEEASVKVKFNDPVEEELLYPGSYDLKELADIFASFKPTKEGYAFAGWYLDKAYTTEFNPNNYTGTEALLNVYAKWDELRKIETYNGTNPLDKYYYDDLVKGTVKIPAANKNGFEFIGWTTDPEGTNSFDLNTFVYPENLKTFNIYAKFEIITNISFMNGSSLVSKVNLKDLKSGEVSAPAITKAGFNFAGWFLDEAYTNEFNANSYVGTQSNVSVYAKWSAKPEVAYYDGETLLKKFYLEDADNNTVANPTKAGYEFVGWVDAKGLEFSINKSATENQVAYAKWEQLVTVNFYNGTELVTSKYLNELTQSTLPVVSKENYTFVNWCSDSQLTTVFDLTKVTSQVKNVNVYAKFVINTTIQFMNGTELVAERLLSGLKNGSLTVPTVTKAGFVFNGWTTDEAGSYEFNVKNFESAELNVKVYAQWTEKVKVNYYVDSTLFDSKVLDDIDNDYEPADPTKVGYDFVGWVDASGNEFELNVESTENLVAYAKFEQKVTVNFYNGTELVATKYLDELTQSTLPVTSKETYTFKGWFLDEAFTTAFVVEGYPTTIKTVNVYAKFEKITTVIFMNGEEEVARVLLSALKDGTATAPKVTKAGSVFNQWLNGETPFVASTFTTDEATITVVADWTEKAKVNYYVDSTLFDSKVLDDIDNDYEPADPTKVGYDFVGWVDEDGEVFVLDVTSEENLTAIAKFEQKVTVNFYNGSELVVSKYLDELTQSTLPVTSKETYTFKGWFLDEEFTSAFVVEGYPTTIKTVNVYAKFEKITTVIFMNGEEEVARVLLSALKDGTATAPTASKYGYAFKEWKYNEETFVASAVTTDEATITVSATFTERAKLIFNVDGGVYATKYLFEITADYKPATPTKDGFFFGYWCNSEDIKIESFVEYKDSTNNLNVYAVWYKNPSIEGLTSNTYGTLISVSWLQEENITYMAKLDNGEFEEASGGVYNLPDDATIGKHTITVKAIYLGHEATATIEVTQLVDFELTNVSFDKYTRTVTWDAVEGATKYDYKFNNAANWTTVYTNSFVVPETVTADSYTLTVTAYVTVNDMVIGSFEPKSDMVNVISIERIDQNGLYINENDEYVLNIGVAYSFGSFTFPEASWYTLTDSATKITPKAGEAGNVYELATTTGEKINVCVEELVASINSGVNYSYYQFARADAFSDTNVIGFIDTNRLYEIGTGDNNFVIDIDVDGTATKVIDYKFDIIGKVGEDTDISKYLTVEKDEFNNVYKICWTSAGQELAEGTVIELTLVSHYSTKSQRDTTVPSYTFRFKTNNGANAYGFEELKELVETLNITTVNMHQRIEITDSMIPATYGTVDPSKNDADYYNKDYYSLIYRQDNGQHNFKLNGNYFDIDVSRIRKAVSKEQDAGPGYKVYWQRAGVFFFNGGEAAQETIGDYQVSNNKDVVVTNLRIKGNATLGMPQSILSLGEQAVKDELLKQSGAIDGIIIGGYNTRFDNVVIHHCTEATKIQSNNGWNGSKVIYRKNNTHLFDKCSFGDNWANDTYIWSDGLVKYKDSYIYDTSGVALIVGDNHSVTNSYDVAEEYVDEENGVFLCNFTEVVLDNTTVSNWKLGSEEYFTAYGMAGNIADYKVAMEGQIKAATNEAYTLIKTDANDFTYVNMAIQANAEDTLKSMNIGTTKKDGTIAWAQVRNQDIGGGNWKPSHPMASAPNYQVLFPICDYSIADNYNAFLADFTNEYTAYCGYCMGQIDYATAKSLMPHLIETYSEAAVQAKMVPADPAQAANIGMQVLFTCAFNNALNNMTDNGMLYVEVNVPNLNGNYSNYSSTIVISGYKK